MMNKTDLLNLFKIEDINSLPDAIMRLIEGNTSDRDAAYKKLLSLNNMDVSFDWFQEIYEDELSERGQKKQDFTPNIVGVLAAKLTGNSGSIYEPTAGNGSMIITAWWERCLNTLPFLYHPSDNIVCCWELSSRSIPLLLLNLSIRGIMGYVYHGDVLEQTVKAKYVLLNRGDDYLSFSDVIKDESNTLKIIQL